MHDLELAESCLQSEEKAGQGLLDILMDGRFLPKQGLLSDSKSART